MLRLSTVPSAHDITISAEDLGQATDHHIDKCQHVHVKEVAYRFVDHDREVVLCR